jgi:hypothetical protein
MFPAYNKLLCIYHLYLPLKWIWNYVIYLSHIVSWATLAYNCCRKTIYFVVSVFFLDFCCFDSEVPPVINFIWSLKKTIIILRMLSSIEDAWGRNREECGAAVHDSEPYIQPATNLECQCVHFGYIGHEEQAIYLVPGVKMPRLGRLLCYSV